MAAARTPFASVLIANRGEIACRIIRTAHRFGLRTIAVYSDADETALHVAQADVAVRIGPAPAVQSYLNIEAVLAAAAATGAEAVHPGYGFLAENASFAERCHEAGLVFVGPPPAAIRAMGDKAAAKRLMEQAGVPLVPGYHGADQQPARLAKEAESVGYPVLIKAAAGGGGKGMRIVEEPDALPDAVAAARREAAAAFGDDQVILESYVRSPRHIEVQVFADRHGDVVHLFERDCSLQRRHQKVVEEAPAPGLDAVKRQAIADAAIAAARAVSYEGAGTVEFLMAPDGRFFFLEMNTRLQVEHPVTEFITGQDLVAWQFQVAAGDPLPSGASRIALDGHAIEARLYAEDPAHGFLPATGTIVRLDLPPDGTTLRVDTGVRVGDTIGIDYDPLLAKLIVHGPDRTAAVRQLQQALDQARVYGLTTNLAFLRRLAHFADFAAGPVDTGLIDRHAATLAPPPEVTLQLLALTALAVLEVSPQASIRPSASAADPHSPWAQADGWRLNAPPRRVVYLADDRDEYTLSAVASAKGWRLDSAIGGSTARLLAADGDQLTADIDGMAVHATALRHDDTLFITLAGTDYRLRLFDPAAQAAFGERSAGTLTAPMPGRVTQVHVAVGESVARGQALMIVEAMKMEHTIAAPTDGDVAAVHYRVGEQVSEGAELLEIHTAEASK